MIAANKPTITLIGAGLAGCFLGILLAKRGYQVSIYERTTKKDIFKNASKRSVNLTFYGYGVRALKEAGLWKAVKANVLNLQGSITQVGRNASPIVTNLDNTKMPYYTVSRSRLLQTLVEQALLHPAITMHFGTNLLSINRHKRTIAVKDIKSQQKSIVSCDVILGTDGINSQVRKSLQRGQKTTHKLEYATWTYKQITITKELAAALKLKKNFMHAWTRKEAIFTAFPNADGSFAGMLILPNKKEKGFSSLIDNEHIATFFTKHFPNLVPALPVITKSLKKNPESYFVTMATSHWYYKDFMAILGDAAHVFLPFYGQGISTAFADCIKFVGLVKKHGENWQEIFPLYQKSRKKHTDVLGNLSKDSFTRYTRTQRADYSAIYDRLEQLAHQFIPMIQPPLYISVAKDPMHAATYFQKYQRQKKIAQNIGIPLLVRIMTSLVGFREKFK